MKTKPKIGVSSCLLGENTRYDGGNKLEPFLVEVLARYADFVHVCPEVECGLPVPREKMHLEGGAESPLLFTTNTRKNLTTQMENFCARRLNELAGENLDGFVFKSKSPSCGAGSTPIYDGRGKYIATASGLFAKAFAKNFPALPSAEETDIKDEKRRREFLQKVFAHAKLPFPPALGI